MLEVAIIGAGTSGLVTARHLIHAGLRPTVFEVAKTLGGAWTPPTSTLATPSSSASSSHSEDDDSFGRRDSSSLVSARSHPASKMWKGMTTNLSKYTCRFSDWPWPEDASTFPTVEEMHNYLNSYAENFLFQSSSANISCNFQLGCKVFNVEQMESSTQDTMHGGNYKVEWTDLSTQLTHCQGFDSVVLATGFFHTPRWPAFLKNRIGSHKSHNNRRLLHSVDYKTHHPFRNKKVAVIGSSFSALEIASDVSRSAASVINVIPSKPWVLSRWIPTIQPAQSSTNNKESENNSTITILPADLVLYRRNHPYPQIPEKILLSPEDCRKRHMFLQSLIGHKQYNSKLGVPTNFDEPPSVAISDEYLDLVRENKIEVVHGRLVGLDDEDGTLDITSCGSELDGMNGDLQSQSMKIYDIDHVICCTGYAPQLHEILSPSILNTLEYDPDDTFCPITLAWDTLHPSLPHLAFCGMYRGPYMGVMELQARLISGILSGKISVQNDQIQSAIETSRKVRTAIPRAQFPHFDYPGFMDTLSRLCDTGEYPTLNLNVGDTVIPSFYQPDNDHSKKCILEIEEEVRRGQDGSRMPKLILKSILGSWSFDRHIIHLQAMKTERVYGTVQFSKYKDTFDPENTEDLVRVEKTDDNPVRYREDGWYEMTPTQKFEVFREYEYECKYDTLEIYFVEGGVRTYLFLSLKFVPEMTALHDDEYWVEATSDHLCIKDLYSATFRVKLSGLSASEIIIKYRVKGPNKDYESITTLKPKI